jgi:N-acetylglucosamine-6-phosphate deacetylase
MDSNSKTSPSPITRIYNARVLRDHKIWEDETLWIMDGRIADPRHLFWVECRMPDKHIDAQGLLVVPGYIDIQVNGTCPQLATCQQRVRRGHPL